MPLVSFFLSRPAHLQIFCCESSIFYNPSPSFILVLRRRNPLRIRFLKVPFRTSASFSTSIATMLAPLRRCSASLPRFSRFASTSSRSAFVASPAHILRLSRQSKTVLPAIRSFTSTSRWREVEEGPITRFEELDMKGLVHPSVIQSITEDMKLSSMTDVQTATINEALAGRDMYVGINPCSRWHVY